MAVLAIAILVQILLMIMSPPERDLTCIGSPLSEVRSTIQKATVGAGLTARSGELCMAENQVFSAQRVMDTLSELEPAIYISFECEQDATICRGDASALIVTPANITARRTAEFKALVDCVGNNCKVKIIDNPLCC